MNRNVPFDDCRRRRSVCGRCAPQTPIVFWMVLRYLPPILFLVLIKLLSNKWRYSESQPTTIDGKTIVYFVFFHIHCYCCCCWKLCTVHIRFCMYSRVNCNRKSKSQTILSKNRQTDMKRNSRIKQSKIYTQTNNTRSQKHMNIPYIVSYFFVTYFFLLSFGIEFGLVFRVDQKFPQYVWLHISFYSFEIYIHIHGTAHTHIRFDVHFEEVATSKRRRQLEDGREDDSTTSVYLVFDFPIGKCE